MDQEASCVWNLNHFLSLCVFCCCIIKTQLLLLYFISKGHSKGSTHRIYGEKAKHQMKNWVECSPDLEFVDLCVFWVVWGASGRRYNDSLLKDWFCATVYDWVLFNAHIILAKIISITCGWRWAVNVALFIFYSPNSCLCVRVCHVCAWVCHPAVWRGFYGSDATSQRAQHVTCPALKSHRTAAAVHSLHTPPSTSCIIVILKWCNSRHCHSPWRLMPPTPTPTFSLWFVSKKMVNWLVSTVLEMEGVGWKACYSPDMTTILLVM